MLNILDKPTYTANAAIDCLRLFGMWTVLQLAVQLFEFLSGPLRQKIFAPSSRLRPLMKNLSYHLKNWQGTWSLRRERRKLKKLGRLGGSRLKQG